MLASTDPVLFVVLVLVLLLLLVVLRGHRRRHAVESRLLAQATGHPSTGLPRGLTAAQRAVVARDVADQLAAAGMVCERLPTGSVVLARAMDGEYVVDVGPNHVTARYHSNFAQRELGRFAGAYAAVCAVVDHARLTTG